MAATLPPFSHPAPPSPDFSDSEEADVATLTAKKLLAGLHDSTRSSDAVCYERRLGDSELSYYLPSRANGVNDMYLHLGFRAPERFLRRVRVQTVWSILRMRHPLMASRVVMRDYDDVRFVFTRPSSPEAALLEADRQLEYRTQSKDDLIDSYLNGPRTLSNDRLSYLIVSQAPTTEGLLPTPPPTPTLSKPSWEGAESTFQYELLICAAHFIGDGMALHQFANDLFGLLAGPRSQEDLEELARAEWQQRWGDRIDGTNSTPPLPLSLEESLPKELAKFKRVVGQVDFQNNLARQIGGHTFPRRSDTVRHTIVPTVPYDEETTRAILKKCKAHGVSIASALFAICNFAWARMTPREKQKLPMMMYAALNVRPYFIPKPLNDSYWFLAVGYFNVMLPNFIPSSCESEKTFWLRARAAKDQSTRAAKNPMVVTRHREMARKRGRQSRAWAREDDEKDAGTWVPPPPTPAPKTSAAASPPSSALIGLSLLGNLDGIYKHATFPDIKLHTLTTGSRQRHSGMLLFGYTFAGKLWVSLGYDENGFERKSVDMFWKNVLGAIDEFLV